MAQAVHYAHPPAPPLPSCHPPQDGSQAIEGLPLPHIDVRDVRSHYGDTACFGNAEARDQPLALWTRLESCVRCGGSGSEGGGLTGGGRVGREEGVTA